MALTASKVKTAMVGRHSDKGGLILKVHATGLKQWFVRVQVRGRRTERLIGKYPDLSLADARIRATQWKESIKSGTDPRKPQDIPDFNSMARKVLKTLEPTWRNAKHSKQWESTLDTYAGPFIGRLRIDQITSADILEVLTPIWNLKRETARRVKQRMAIVFDASVVEGYRDTNPVHPVSAALPKTGKPVRHMPSMPYSDIPKFLEELWASPRVTEIIKLAIEFTILTASRSGEVRNARWDEIKDDLWIIPSTRMKAGREHRAPLSPRSLAILARASELRTGDYLFCGRSGRGMSDMTLQQPLRRIDGRGFTMHGFRSSFRDWASEKTTTEWAVIELSLAHAVGNQVERAYARSDLLEKRKFLHEQWENYLKPHESTPFD